MNDNIKMANKNSIINFMPNLILPPNKTVKKNDLTAVDFNLKNFIKKGENRKENKSMNNDLRIKKISRLLEKVLDNKIRQVSEVHKCTLLYEIKNKYKRSGENFKKEDDFFTGFNLNNRSYHLTANENGDLTFSNQPKGNKNILRDSYSPDYSGNRSKLSQMDELENFHIKRINLDFNHDNSEKYSPYNTIGNFKSKNDDNNTKTTCFDKNNWDNNFQLDINNNECLIKSNIHHNYQEKNINKISRGSFQNHSSSAEKKNIYYLDDNNFNYNKIESQIDNKLNLIAMERFENNKSKTEEIKIDIFQSKLTGINEFLNSKRSGSGSPKKAENLRKSVEVQINKKDFDDIFNKIKILKTNRKKNKDTMDQDICKKGLTLNENPEPRKDEYDCDIKNVNKINDFNIKKLNDNKRENNSLEKKLKDKQISLNTDININNLKNPLIYDELFNTKIGTKTERLYKISPKNIIKANKQIDEINLKRSNDFFSIYQKNEENNVQNMKIPYEIQNAESIKIANFSKTDPSSFKIFNSGFAIDNAYSKHESLIYDSNHIGRENNIYRETERNNYIVEDIHFTFTPRVIHRSQKSNYSSDRENKSILSEANSQDAKRRSIPKDSPSILLFKDLVNRNAEKEKSREEMEFSRESLKHKSIPLCEISSNNTNFINFAEKNSSNISYINSFNAKKNNILNFKSLREIKKSSPKKEHLKDFKINFDDLNCILLSNSNRYNRDSFSKENQLNSNLLAKDVSKPDEKISDNQYNQQFLLGGGSLKRKNENYQNKEIEKTEDFPNNQLIKLLNKTLSKNDEKENFTKEIEILELKFADRGLNEEFLKRSKSENTLKLSSTRYQNLEGNNYLNSPLKNKNINRNSAISNDKEIKMITSFSDSKNKNFINKFQKYNENNSNNFYHQDLQPNNTNTTIINPIINRDKFKNKNIESLSDFNSLAETRSNLNSFAESKQTAFKKDFLRESNIKLKESGSKSFINQITNSASGFYKNPVNNALLDSKKIEDSNICNVNINKNNFYSNENAEKFSNMKLNNLENKVDFKKKKQENKIRNSKNFYELDNLVGNKLRNKETLSNDNKRPNNEIINGLDFIWDANKVLVKSKSFIGRDSINIFKKIDKHNKDSLRDFAFLNNSREKKNWESPKKKSSEFKINQNFRPITKLDDLPNYSNMNEIINSKKKSENELHILAQKSNLSLFNSKESEPKQDSRIPEAFILLRAQNLNSRVNNFLRNNYNDENFNNSNIIVNQKLNENLKKFNTEIFNFTKQELNKQILSLWKSNINQNIQISNIEKKQEKKENEKENKNFNDSRISKSTLLINLEKRLTDDINAVILDKFKDSKDNKIIKSKSDSGNKLIDKNTYSQNLSEKYLDKKKNKEVQLKNDEINFKIDIKKIKSNTIEATKVGNKNKNPKIQQIKSNIYTNSYSNRFINNINYANNENKHRKSLNEKDCNFAKLSTSRFNPSKTTSAGFFNKKKSEVPNDLKNNVVDKYEKILNINKNIIDPKSLLNLVKNKNPQEINIVNVEKKKKNSANLKSPVNKKNSKIVKKATIQQNEINKNKIYFKDALKQSKNQSDNFYNKENEKNNDDIYKNFEFVKDSLILDNNSVENLNENQKKIIESLISDRELLKFLENKMNQVTTGNNLNFIETKNFSNNFTNSNFNIPKIDPNITRDKIDLFKENISHLFYSYNNELEVPKLEEDKLSESNRSNKEKLNENSDCEPYEICNSNTSKEDFGVSKLSEVHIKKNNNVENNLNPNSFNNNLNINNNDDTIYCLRESLEEKSNKKFIRNHKNITIQNDANNSSSNDKLTKTFFKENKTEYFKNLSKSHKNEKSIIGKNSPNLTTTIHNLKTISSNSNQKDKKLPYFLKINKVESENEREGKYTFRKCGKDNISKNNTYSNIKMSPILKQIDNDEEFYNICTNVNNNNTFTIEMKNTNQKFNDTSNFLDSNRNFDKKRNSQIKPNSKSYSERFHILRIKNKSNPNDKLINNKEIKSIKIAKNIKKSNVFKIQSKKKQIFPSTKNEKPLLQSKINNCKDNLNNIENIDKSLLMGKVKISPNNDFDTHIKNKNINNNKLNPNKNQVNALDFINEEFKKIVSAQEKNKSIAVSKFLNLDNLDFKSNNNSIYNNNFLNSFSPRDFLPNEISIKDEYKSSFKSESLINPWNFNSIQKNDMNKFLNVNKPFNNNEDLEIDIENPEFINNFSNNNGLENTHKTAINEMSNINCENFNSLNMENEKDLILVENIENLCKAGKNNNSNKQQFEEDNVNYNFEKNQKLNLQHNNNKSIDYEEGLNTDIIKKSDVYNKIPNNNNNDILYNNKKSSIIDILTQEARDRAIIKVESEKIVTEIQNNLNPNCQGKGNKKTQNNNLSGIINNYNNIYITEVHTYTGRKKNVKNFK